MLRDVGGYLAPRFGPFALGAAVMGVIWLYNDPASNIIASSPDRIIPSAIERTMATEALNPDLLEVRICNADPKQEGNETVFVIYNSKEDREEDENGVKLLVSLGLDGSPVLTSYEGEKWRCGRPRS